MEQYEQCKSTNFQLVMHLGLVSTQITALFKLLCASNPGTLWAIICWPCLMHMQSLGPGYLVGWHGVGHAGLTSHTAPAAPSALCIHGTITLYPKHGAAGNWLTQSGELSAELPKAWLQHKQ